MCGILGVRRDSATRESASAALDTLAWRGRDSRGLVAAGDWWLGAARLAISDPASDQPLVDQSSGDVVVFNGAVTSARSERRTLRTPLQSGNDAELLLRRMQERGQDQLLAMTGPYAFAVYRAATGTLWLGSDPTGEKPLWAVLDTEDRLLAFASTPAALRALGFANRLDTRGRAMFLRYGFCPSLVSSGEAGESSLRVTGDLRGLWESPAATGAPLRRLAALPGRTVRHGAASIRDALVGAVGRCADAEVPVAVSLSGGIDSACIASVLPRSRRGVWHGWQFKADGEPGDERDRARACAAQFGMQLREVDGDASLVRELPQLIAQHGAPLGDPSVLAVHALCVAARADGVRVLLSGEGADDLLLGYPRHGAARRLPRRGLSFVPLPPRFAQGRDRSARMLRALTSRRPYDALLEVMPAAVRRRLLAPELAADSVSDLPPTSGSSLERARRLDREYYLRFDLLPKLDTATLAAGVEGRCPFLDPEVLFSAVVSRSSKELVGKRPLRDEFEVDLPAGHLDQPKRGFAIPLDRWFGEDDFFADLLLDARTLERGLVDPDALRLAVDAQRAGKIRLGPSLWLLAALELFERDIEAPA